MTIRTALSALLFVSSLAPLWASPRAEAPDYTDPEALAALIEARGEDLAEDYILIDVRSEAEYASGHIPGALNIAFDVLAENLPTEDRGALIIVYCRSGRRSSIAAQTLKELGFTDVHDFGGITRWPGELAYPEHRLREN